MEKLRKICLAHADVAACALLAALCLCLYLPRLGAYALWDPWEAQYAQVGWEMLEHGTWNDPVYRGAFNWWSKPIFTLWLLRGSFTLFGAGDMQARLPFALMGCLGACLFYLALARLLSRRAALLSAAVLALSPQYFFIARSVMVDVPFVALYAPAVILLAAGSLDPQSPRPRLVYLSFALIGLAALVKGLLAVVLPAAIFGVYILVTWDWGLLKRARLHWGALIFLAVAAPWFIFMGVKHGRPFLYEFFVIHHLDRMAGTIGKPDYTFDVYVKQVGFALFPWISFLPLALGRFVTWSGRDLDSDRRRNLLVMLAAAVPFVFFSLSATKFNHYIFPVIPFLAAAIGWTLDGFASGEDRRDLRIGALAAIAVFAVLATDVVKDFKWLVSLFIYYYDRDMPPQVNPDLAFRIIFYAWAALLTLLLLKRRIGNLMFGSLAAAAAAFACVCNFYVVPAVTDVFTLKPMYDAYVRDGGERDGAPVAYYQTWLERSVSYYFRNKAQHLKRPEEAARFCNRAGRAYIIVERNMLPELRTAVKRDTGKSLHVVLEGHPIAYLVTTEPSPESEEKLRALVTAEQPEMQRKIYGEEGANLENKVIVLGWSMARAEVEKGGEVEVTLFFKCTNRLDTDYLVFIHGDGPYEGSHRIHGEHPPASGLYPTTDWKPGEYVRDVFRLQVPRGYPYDNFTVWFGLYNGPKRLELVNRAPSDGFNRLRGPTVRVK